MVRYLLANKTHNGPSTGDYTHAVEHKRRKRNETHVPVVLSYLLAVPCLLAYCPPHNVPHNDGLQQACNWQQEMDLSKC